MIQHIPEYYDELNNNHDIKAIPRVRAEWNWNATSLLAEPAKRGPELRIYKYWSGSNNAPLAPINSEASLGAVFQPARLVKTLNFNSVNYDSKANYPNISYGPEVNDQDFKPGDVRYTGIHSTFYLDVKEAGTWRFYSTADDHHDVFIEGTKILSRYNAGAINGPPEWQTSGQYTFPSAGRYKVESRVFNVDLYFAFYMGYQTPTMQSKNIQPRELTPEMTFHPSEKDGPYSNPEIIGYDADATAVKDWLAWREYFPVWSMTQPRRGESGIHYNELTARNDEAFIMTPQNFVFSPNAPRPHRYYLLNKKDDNAYRYWKSDQVSDSSGNIANATVRVHYSDWVGVNKLVLTLNLGAKPTSMTIRALTKDTQGVESWVSILTPGMAPPIDPNTGKINMYRNDYGVWTSQPFNENDEVVYKQDFSIQVKAIEFTVHKVNKTNSRAEVIEFSARKQLDITDRTISMNSGITVDEEDFSKILGEISANDGQIEISNWDNAFQMSDSEAVSAGVEKLKQTTERSTRIVADMMYDLREQQGPEQYPVRMFTMYSADWSRQGEFDYSINLFDSAKFLQNIECPDIYEKDTPVHMLVSQILDSVGFTRYAIDTEDYLLSAPVLDYFSNVAEASVWDTLKVLCQTSMCAIYFDQYDVLQLITKEQITDKTVAREDVRGQIDVEFPDKIPNLAEFQKSYEIEANKVNITWRPKAVKKNPDPLNNEELTDIVWQSADTVTLRATKLAAPMAYNEENYFSILQEDAEFWPYTGKANVNGEIIQWEGKEYYWIDNTTNPRRFYYEVIFSEEQRRQRDAKALYGYVTKGQNKFTGKIRLKRDKNNKAIGRGADASKFRLDHPTERRPGWTPALFTVGDNNGFFNGYYPGDNPNNFGYKTTNAKDKTTAMGWNRPNIGNANWFRTQVLYRKGNQVAQQWGFKMKFKESQTVGEVSLMFNCGQAFGNSEVATTAGPSGAWNQMYHLTLLETQGLVRDATHEIAAWVQTNDPVYRTFDNAVRGSASRMYNRNYGQSWADRMKGYQYEFKRDVWYDIKVDLTRGRGYGGNNSMHFFVWVNGAPVAGFDAAGPGNRHKFLAPTNAWAIGSRAASKVEIANAYSWTEFADPIVDLEQYRYDFTSGGFVSSFLEDGLLYPSPGKSSPFRDGGPMAGEFFFDDFGSTLHEIREYDVNLDKAPVESVNALVSNPGVRVLDLKYSPNKAKFSVVNVTDSDVLAHGTQDLPNGGSVNHSMVLFGYVLTEQDEETVVRFNRDSIKDRGEVTMDIDARWINNRDQADDLADWVVKHFSDPKDVININVFGDASFNVGDKINIHYDKGEVDKTWVYIVSSIKMSYSAEDGLDVQLTVRMVRDNKVTDESR